MACISLVIMAVKINKLTDKRQKEEKKKTKFTFGLKCALLLYEQRPIHRSEIGRWS